MVNIGCKLLNEGNIALKPLKLTIEVFSRKDATLISADLVLNCMQQKPKESTIQISCNLLTNLSKRIEEHINSDLIKLIKCLKDTNTVPFKEQLNFVTNLMKKLVSIDVDENNIMVIENDVVIQSEKPDRSITMEK